MGVAKIVHEFIESKTGDWGKPGRDYCSKCKKAVNIRYNFCPWCGVPFNAIKNVIILKDGGMWDA